MKEVIKIGKQEIPVDNNIGWVLEYRDQFGKDILPVLMPLFTSFLEAASSVIADSGSEEINAKDIAESINGRVMDTVLPLYSAEFSDLAVNIPWAMAKAADDSIDPPKQWVKQFDVYPVDVILPKVFNLALKGSISSKNLKRLKKLETAIKNLQPSNSTILSSPVSSEA